MLTLTIILVVAYIVLKTINTRARFAEADARREAEEQAAKLAAEEAAEEEEIRAAAVDVDAEVIEDGEKIFDAEPEAVMEEA